MRKFFKGLIKYKEKILGLYIERIDVNSQDFIFYLFNKNQINGDEFSSNNLCAGSLKNILKKYGDVYYESLDDYKKGNQKSITEFVKNI